jgi:hypothetical protein
MAEIFQVLFRNASFKERPRIHSGRGVALEVDEVAGLIAVLAVEEVVVANLGERGERGIGGNMAADAGIVFVGADHHGHGVPAIEAFDAALNFAVARIGHLFLYRDGIDVGRGELVRCLDAVERRVIDEAAKQEGGAFGAAVFQNRVQ